MASNGQKKVTPPTAAKPVVIVNPAADAAAGAAAQQKAAIEEEAKEKDAGAAAEKKAQNIRARVLQTTEVDGIKIEANSVVEGDAKTIAAYVAQGAFDSHQDAVAYALNGENAKVVKL